MKNVTYLGTKKGTSFFFQDRNGKGFFFNKMNVNVNEFLLNELSKH
jgi:hypothetical protein